MKIIRTPDPEDPDGDELKRLGMQRALNAAREVWKLNFQLHVIRLAQEGYPFTSEDVLARVGLPNGEVGQHKNNAVGAMMNAMAKKKIIQKTGNHVKSKRPTSHDAELTEWIQL